MKTPHKHAEVTITWLQDQSLELEFKRPLPGAVWEVTYGELNPILNPDYEWRVKPEPKPDVFLHCHMDQRGFDSLTERFVDGDNLKLTFSGETGKLIKAEVVS